MRSTRLRTFARAGLAAAMLAAPLAVMQAPTARAAVFALADAMRNGGPGAFALYAAVYALGSLLALPLWMLSGLAGFAYGFPRGVAAALPALCAGSTCAFLAGRALSRTALGAALREHPRFRPVDLVVRRDGRRVATLLRLSPAMPQNLLHFAFGATPLRARDFVASTALGLLPMTCFHVYGGSLVEHAADLLRSGRSPLRDPATLAKALAGLAVTAAMLALVMRRARSLLARAYAEASARQDVDPEAREQ